MPTCKICNKKYHFCSSCGCNSPFELNYHDIYCSTTCFEKSKQYNDIISDINIVTEKIKNEQGIIETLIRLLDNDYCINLLLNELFKIKSK